MVDIYYFDKPIIAYCPECEVTAIYHNGLVCPNCQNRDELSIFEWDENSKYPVKENNP